MNKKKSFDKSKKDIDYKQNPKGKQTYSGKGREKVMESPKYNDPAWYKITEQLGKDVSQIPFNVFPGTQESTTNFGLNPGSLSIDRTYDPQATPGVLLLRYVNVPGYSNDGGSALNIAAKSMYTWVRHRNSGRVNYEASDLGMYVLALAEIYSDWFEAKRIYDIAMTYSYTNKNLPDTLLDAMGVNTQDIRDNLAQFRYKLNILSAKINSMALPTTFTMFKRQAFIASQVFSDSDASTSQYYMYCKYITREFDATTQGGGSLKQRSYTRINNKRTFKTITDDIDYLISLMVADEDMNIISGDILKAFGSDYLYLLPEVTEDERMMPIFSEDVLGQIHNSFSVSTDALDVGLWSITQSNNNMLARQRTILANNSTPRAVIETNLLRDNVYFNSHKADPTADDCIEWSRNMVGGMPDASDNKITNLSTGTEFIVDYQVWTVQYATNGTRSIIGRTFNSVFNIINNDDLINTPTATLTALSKFDWAPMLYLYAVLEDDIFYYGVYGDLKRYTLVAGETRNRLNESAVMAELGALLLEKIKSQASPNSN